MLPAYILAMLIDLHVHSSISPCSCLGMADILSHARGLGLDGVCITDHDCMDARFDVTEGLQSDGLLVLIGMEYATAQGDFLIFGPFESLRPGLPAMEMLQLVHKAGGAAVAAHPCRSLRPADATLAANGLLAAVERVNGRNTTKENERAGEWEMRSIQHKLHSTAGSDAHTLSELGRAPTRFHTHVRSRTDLINALNSGMCSHAVHAPLKDRLHAHPSGYFCPLPAQNFAGMAR